MKKVFEKSRVLIVNAATPAGRAARSACEARGLIVVAAGRDDDSSEMAGADLIRLKTSDPSSIEKLALRLDEEGIVVDTLIICPGTVWGDDNDGWKSPLEKMEPDYWHKIIEENLTSSMLVCRSFGARMRRRNAGRIIQLVSNVALDPHWPDEEGGSADRFYPPAAYAAAMGGLLAFSRHLAAQYRDSGPLVNNLVYGPLVTAEPCFLSKSYLERVPLGRIMTETDLSNAIDLLLDPCNRYMTGQNFVVDGGVGIW